MIDLSSWTSCKRPAPDCLIGQYTRLERLDWARHGSGLFAASGRQIKRLEDLRI